MSQSPEEEKPLAAAPSSSISSHYQICIKCCGCFAAVFLIAITTALILTFTIFRVRDPVLTADFHIRGVGERLESGFIPSNIVHGTTLNLTFEASFSVRNPNLAHFMIRHAALLVYYHGQLVGQAEPSSVEEVVPARASLTMNMSADITVERDDGIMIFYTNTKINGVVRISSVSMRHITLNTNCSVYVNISSSSSMIQQQNCTGRAFLK